MTTKTEMPTRTEMTTKTEMPTRTEMTTTEMPTTTEMITKNEMPTRTEMTTKTEMPTRTVDNQRNCAGINPLIPARHDRLPSPVQAQRAARSTYQLRGLAQGRGALRPTTVRPTPTATLHTDNC